MATKNTLTASLRGLPKDSAITLARQFAGIDLQKVGKVHVFPYGKPVEEWVISVLPASAAHARQLLDTLISQPNYRKFEVFPYGILNPEIGRVDIRMSAH